MIQTVGRAARNINGRAIMYADKITKSMQTTLDETEYRRAKQMQYNEEHGVVPRALNKKISESLVGRSKINGLMELLIPIRMSLKNR